jgi:hypothetical protein
VKPHTQSFAQQDRNTASPPKFYTIPQVAEILQISPRTLQAWCAVGAVPFLRLNRKIIRFTEEHLAQISRSGANVPLKYKVAL